MKTIFRLSPIAVALAVYASGPNAFAQTKPLEVLVTAPAVIDSNSTDDMAGFKTTVTSRQIEDLNAIDAAAALRRTPGVSISRFNPVGSFGGEEGGAVYIRGMGTSRPGSEIKTYIDGVPFYMGIWNHPLLDLLPLNGMSRIDVFKGPQLHEFGNTFGANAFHVRVTIAPAASPSGPPPQPLNLPSGGRSPTSPTLSPPLLSSATPRTPFTSDTTSFLILVLLEDGRSLQPVVWGSMQIRQLCQQVGAFAHVSHDTVFLQYAGSVLDPERRIHEPPGNSDWSPSLCFLFDCSGFAFCGSSNAGWITPTPTTTVSSSFLWVGSSSWTCHPDTCGIDFPDPHGSYDASWSYSLVHD